MGDCPAAERPTSAHPERHMLDATRSERRPAAVGLLLQVEARMAEIQQRLESRVAGMAPSARQRFMELQQEQVRPGHGFVQAIQTLHPCLPCFGFELLVLWEMGREGDNRDTADVFASLSKKMQLELAQADASLSSAASHDD